MAYWLPRQGAAHFTTAIARMLGKAVKFRHCPATVSATRRSPVLCGHRMSKISARVVPPTAEQPRETTGAE